MFAVRLSKELETRLKQLADKTHRSQSFYVRQAIETFLNDQEDVLAAMQSYEDYLKSGKKTVDLETLTKDVYGH